AGVSPHCSLRKETITTRCCCACELDQSLVLNTVATCDWFSVRNTSGRRGETMKGFTPDLFDRLLGQPQRNGVVVARLNVEELKDAVARDLEALLNTRSTIQDGALAVFAECRQSMVGYGLCDFADRSLSSPTDRAHICACIEQTIARHEPRLQNVKALLEMRDEAGAPSVNRLGFSITGVLVGS